MAFSYTWASANFDQRMKLITSLTSPFGRKVRVALAEKRLDCPLQIDIPWNDDTAVPQYNPLGKIPVLLMDDGSTLFDSRVIVEYLDNLSPVGRLLPTNARDHIQVKRWEALADGVSDAAAAIFIERRRAAEQQSQDWIQRQQLKIDRGLEALAEELGDAPWCMNDSYTLADIATGCTLGYLAFRFPENDWHQRYPNLGRLYDKLMLRPSFADTQPPAV